MSVLLTVQFCVFNLIQLRIWVENRMREKMNHPKTIRESRG